MVRRALVAQSGGPSPVIDASLLGVVEGCRAFPERIGSILGAGAIGTCRHKLTDGQEEDFERIVEVMRAHDVGDPEFRLVDHTPWRRRCRPPRRSASGSTARRPARLTRSSASAAR